MAEILPIRNKTLSNQPFRLRFGRKQIKKNCTLDYEETMVNIDNKYAMISQNTG